MLIKFISARFKNAGKSRRFLNFAKTVAFLSVALGCIALEISLAVLDGFDSQLHENAIKFSSHIKLETYRHIPIHNYEGMIKDLKNDNPQIVSAEATIEKECLVRFKNSVDGILVHGLLTDSLPNNLNANIQAGSKQFSNDSAFEVFIGQRLADKMGSKIGDKIILYSIKNAIYGSVPAASYDAFVVRGIYRTGMAQYDDIYIYTPFKTARTFFEVPEDCANSIGIMLKNVEESPAIAEKIEKRLGYPYFSLTVYDLHGSIFAWIELQKKPIPIILGLISIVAVLNIVTTLLITVVEKTYTIGILRSLGIKNSNILSLFIFQGLKIGVAGVLFGSALSLIFCILQNKFGLIRLNGEIYFLDQLPVHIEAWHYIIVSFASITLSLLSTLIPSWIAVRITPLRAIRFR
ncbi:MAG: ABC transporter permease [Candidatus Kapabacteria bacterium]|nr:ABC transporter permease [Candidatus Kapabacteria bacterium]